MADEFTYSPEADVSSDTALPISIKSKKTEDPNDRLLLSPLDPKKIAKFDSPIPSRIMSEITNQSPSQVDVQAAISCVMKEMSETKSTAFARESFINRME